MLICQTVEERGVINVSGIVPNGKVTVVRRSPNGSMTLRGGENLTITNEGLILEDDEASLGIPLTYTATSTPANRIVERNLVYTPDFSHGAGSWTGPAGRTFSVSGGFGQVGANFSGATQGTPGRTVAEVGISALQPNTSYLVSGRVKFHTPNIITWQTVKDTYATWGDVLAANATWGQLLSNTSVLPTDTFLRLYVSLANGTTVTLAPILGLEVLAGRVNQWITFNVWITTPATLPAGTRLRLLHGTGAQEYQCTWELDQFSLMTNTDADHLYQLPWFSGDTPVPDDPAYYIGQDTTWVDLSHDSSITWEGAVGNSVSRFTGPSKLSTSTTTTLHAPASLTVCSPVLLSDPVNSAYAIWVGLGPMEAIDWAGRTNIQTVIDRADYIPTATIRQLAKGTFTFMTNTLEQRAKLLAVLSTGRVLLIRNPDPSYPESDWYLACLDVRENRPLPDGRRPEREWTVTYAQTARPVGLIQLSSTLTWQQIKDTGWTWDELNAKRSNWLDVLTNFGTAAGGDYVADPAQVGHPLPGMTWP